MKKATYEKIMSAWDTLADDDRSTEWCISTVASHCGVDYSTVVSALRISSETTASQGDE